jgi:TetR/AcrR family transcriptional regulator
MRAKTTATKRSPPAVARAGAKRRPRDATRTRQRILDCATQEFAAHGYDGARVERIVRAAGVNISLAYQYFGSKEKLFIAVMEGAYATVRRHHGDIAIREQDPEEAMASLVRSTFRIFVDFPEMISLLAIENLHRARHVAKSAFIRRLYGPLLATMREILRRGEDAGVFRSGVDPAQLFITITGVGYFYLSNKHTLGVILHRDLTRPAALAAREAHMVDVVLTYLKQASPRARK